jgi:hypothetical protein
VLRFRIGLSSSSMVFLKFPVPEPPLQPCSQFRQSISRGNIISGLLISLETPAKYGYIACVPSIFRVFRLMPGIKRSAVSSKPPGEENVTARSAGALL